jgi:hypothetical protein
VLGIGAERPAATVEQARAHAQPRGARSRGREGQATRALTTPRRLACGRRASLAATLTVRGAGAGAGLPSGRRASVGGTGAPT